MNIKISELNRRIQIVRNDIFTNNNGVEEEKEVVIANIWGKVQNMSGTEMFKANTGYSKTTTRFIIRYRKNITTDDFVILNNYKFNIVYINNYNYSNEYLEIIGELIV
ncbi:phage head closure protein [Clostridium tertium]|uniref:phage head closure protein n=1 Tax=Clostridium tertium TaxID=1559 RepID=UPI0034A5CC6F